MIDLTVALIVFLFPHGYSPGPGNMFFAANGARFGLRATLPAHVCDHVATWIVTTAIGLGFAAALAQHRFRSDPGRGCLLDDVGLSGTATGP